LLPALKETIEEIQVTQIVPQWTIMLHFVA
jgi:hypothetical protein